MSGTDGLTNRLTEYCVDVGITSDLGSINYRIIITRYVRGGAPVVFEMLLTQEQYVVWQQVWVPL